MAFIASVLSIVSPLLGAEHWIYLDNGHVRLGVNMDAGGSIGWFSRAHSPENLLNAFDHGRYVQQSYYGDIDGSDWNGKPWRYNPVQGGSWKGLPAVVLEQKEENNALYVKTQPRQWASGKDVDDMIMEEWLSLEGSLAKLKFRMTYTGTTEHAPRPQELPAMFVTPSYDTLVYCNEGQPPWTKAALTRRQPGFPNENARFSEPWAAWVNSKGQGIGIYFPGTEAATTYRVTAAGVGNVSYIAPVRSFSLKPGLVFAYDITLALGTSEQLRAVFTALHEREKQ
ncbi:MAG: hypothetical protein JWO08_4678 [Verrucomicrobiaceae bacterium]|nr:hypothetical protein [Verrucomicrobiaceae bacterium]